MRGTRYRSAFEINIAKSLANRDVPFEYEKHKFEVKGHFDKGDRVKMQLIKQQHPNLDIRFVFLRASNKIYRGSKTTYADWANRYSFPWAEGNIPQDWITNG